MKITLPLVISLLFASIQAGPIPTTALSEREPLPPTWCVWALTPYRHLVCDPNQTGNQADPGDGLDESLGNLDGAPVTK